MIIAVASGKGGTGKTTVSVSLALAVSEKTPVSFFDCDVEEPNAHIFLKPKILRELDVEVPVPRIDEEHCTYCGECSRVCRYNAIITLKDRVLVFPELCHGCGGCTLLCPEKVIHEEGRVIGTVRRGEAGCISFTSGLLHAGEVLSPEVIRAAKEHIDGHRVNIIDCPPGTSCPVVESVKGSDFCVLVTEPTPFGLNDLKITIEVLGQLGIPFGVVINKSSPKYDGDMERFCKDSGIEVMLKIPWERSIAEAYSVGEALIHSDGAWTERFSDLFDRIRSRL